MMTATLKEMLDVLHVDTRISSTKEITEACNIITEVQNFDSGERDCIKACFLRGPLFDGDVPSKTSRNSLMEKGFIVKVVVKGEDGFNACTQKGFYAFKLIQIHA